MVLTDEVSKPKRLGQVVASIVFCFLTAGVVFGYAALKPVLLASDVYPELSPLERDTRLNLMFTLATTVTNAAALPIGSLLDRYGPRELTIGGALVFALGNVLFGMQVVRGAFDTYIIGYVLLALGSPAIFLAQFHLSNAFPAYSGVILAAITGAFDASSVPYLVYREIYRATGGAFHIRSFFWLYTIIPAALVVQQLLAAPSSTYLRSSPQEDKPSITAEENEDPNLNIVAARPPSIASPRIGGGGPLSSGVDIVSSGFSRVSYPWHEETWKEDEEDEEGGDLEGSKGDPVFGRMFGRSVAEQVRSGWFWLIAVYLFIQMIRINWYLATVQQQLEYYTGDEGLADSLTKAFTVLLPLGGIVGIPFVGLLLDRRPIRDATFVLLFLGAAFGVLTMLPSTVAQLVGISILVVLRPLFYTFVSDFMAKIFGFATFGTVYGLAITLSGLLSLLLTPLDILTKRGLHGNYTPVNVGLLIGGLLSNVALAGVVAWVGRRGSVRLEGSE